MKILAIETATLFGGLAILDTATGLLIEMRTSVETTHSEKLMTQIAHAFRQTGLSPSDIDVFATSIGPGSFTGLRIGLSTIKGFSYATQKPITTVSTLDALAWHFPYSFVPVCPLLDARKHEVYAGLYEWHADTFRKELPESSLPVHDVIDYVQGRSFQRVLFTGEGSVLYEKPIRDQMGDRAIFATAEKIIPSPAVVAVLAMKNALKEKFAEPITLVPCYIRKSEAELKWRNRKF